MEESLPVGNFVVSKKAKRKIVSNLGSCVGVILIDNSNEVGGMYHVLLPSPLNKHLSHISLNFASVGMPQFINEFIACGGDLKSTNAIIGGGAFLGKISQIDLDMDLGGRTADLVSTILNQKKIEIAESITGGYFACSMKLDLSNLKYKVENIGNSEGSRKDIINKAQDIDIDTAIMRLRPVPQVALKISRMINSDKYSLKDIAKEIRNDQITSAKVIQLSNSSVLKSKVKVSSVDQAIDVLGEKTFLKNILQSSMELYYQNIEKGYSLTKGGIYYHAKSVAIVAEQIANITQKAEPDVAYTAGLLHDVGKIVLDQYIAQIFPTFFDRVFNSKEDLISIEENLLGINHAIAGKRLAELWKLPDSLTEAIEHHNNPEKAKNYSELTHIVYFADLIISRYHTGIEIEKLNTTNFKKRLATIGLESKDFVNLINSLSWNDIYLQM